MEKKIISFFFLIFFSSSGEFLFVQDNSTDLYFTILHTNDEHSHLIPFPAIDDHPDFDNSARGGFARLAAAVKEIRQLKSDKNEPVLVFSGGDILGGPVFGWLPLLPGTAAELALFQDIGYDAVTIGNHEFDYGADLYAQYLKAAGYPEASERTVILGTNTRPPADHSLSEAGIKKHIVKKLDNGLKVGVLGLIGKDAISKTAQPGSVEFDDPIKSAKHAVEELRNAGADVIISVNHAGVYEDRILAREVPDIDVIVGGHSHTPLYEPVIEGKTVIVQAGQYLQYLGVLELVWNREEGRVSVRNEETETAFLKPLDHSVPEDSVIAEQVSYYEEILTRWVAELTGNRITDIRQPVAALSFPLLRNEPRRESALGNFVTDAMKKTAEETTGKRVDLAVQANGALRADIYPGQEVWSEGAVSFYDLMMAVGLGAGADNSPGYPLVSFYITEDEVRRALEVSVLLSVLRGDSYFLQYSGLQMMFDAKRALFIRVPFTGTPIPSFRAVLSAGLHTKDGELLPLKRGSDRLLHVVTDYYIAGFLPLVGEVVPRLAIELKNEAGEPVELNETVIERAGKQVKVWQAVLDYTLSFEKNDADLPVIPAEYKTPQGRMVSVNLLPLWVWPVVILVLLGAGLTYWLRRSRQ